MTPDFGEDRFLPDRLAALGFLIKGERDIFQDYVRLLDGFFTAIRGEVLKPLLRIIDPFGVFHGVAVFNDLLAKFLEGGITTLLNTAYGRVLGDNYPFSNRPYVARHLEQVRNRMVRTPDEVFNYIRVALEEGIDEGEGVPELAERIDQQLLRTNSERWTNRGVVVARTESISAYNGGTNDAFSVIQDETGEAFEKLWLATMDHRTRDTHFIADGQRVAFANPFIVGGFPGMFPGDPLLPAQERIQCRCTFLVVEPGESVDLSNREWKPQEKVDAERARRAARLERRATPAPQPTEQITNAERHDIAKVLSNVEELLSNQASKRALAARGRSLRSLSGNRVELEALFAAMEAGDEAGIRAGIDSAAQRASLVVAGGQAGKYVRFDPEVMSAVAGKSIRRGAPVLVLRPGYQTSDGTVVVLRADVIAATEEEYAAGQ